MTIFGCRIWWKAGYILLCFLYIQSLKMKTNRLCNQNRRTTSETSRSKAGCEAGTDKKTGMNKPPKTPYFGNCFAGILDSVFGIALFVISVLHKILARHADEALIFCGICRKLDATTKLISISWSWMHSSRYVIPVLSC